MAGQDEAGKKSLQNILNRFCQLPVPVRYCIPSIVRRKLDFYGIVDITPIGMVVLLLSE